MYIGTCRSRTFFNRVILPFGCLWTHSWTPCCGKWRTIRSLFLETATIVLNTFRSSLSPFPCWQRGQGTKILLHLENALQLSYNPNFNAAKSISPLYYSAVLSTEVAMDDKKLRMALQEELDVQSEKSSVVNVTTWDEEHSLGRTKQSQFFGRSGG